MSDYVDKRGGAYDPVNPAGNPQPQQVKERTANQKEQWGADLRPEPVRVPHQENYPLPEGLRKERKGPLNKVTGRGPKTYRKASRRRRTLFASPMALRAEGPLDPLHLRALAMSKMPSARPRTGTAAHLLRCSRERERHARSENIGHCYERMRGGRGCSVGSDGTTCGLLQERSGSGATGRCR
jgi:hypothetical protein